MAILPFKDDGIAAEFFLGAGLIVIDGFVAEFASEDWSYYH